MSIRDELVTYGAKTVHAGLVVAADGNISVRENTTVWMKPSGFAMDEMTADDLCGMDLETGKQVSGPHRPTSEVVMHMAVYRVRPDVVSVFHTHSPWAAGVASAGIEVRPMLVGSVCDLGRMGSLPYVLPASPVIAEAVAEAVGDADTLLLANHGVLAVGASVKQAFFRVAAMEDAAKSWVAASIVGTPQVFSQKQIDEILSLDTVQYRYKTMGS